jgi:hypothetical protein
MGVAATLRAEAIMAASRSANSGRCLTSSAIAIQSLAGGTTCAAAVVVQKKRHSVPSFNA